MELTSDLLTFVRNALELVLGAIGDLLKYIWTDHIQEMSYFTIAAVVAIVRAAGKTVQSGQTGLKFSFGRATRVLEPGFYPLIPFLQIVRIVATRDRTIDLPQQRVTTLDGLVYDVDANVVFRVVDVRKALIEIDDLDRGMYQVLGLGVQEVLRQRERGSMHVSTDLDQSLASTLAERLSPWGVEVQRAGFTSIKPTERTLRVTQLSASVRERLRSLGQLEAAGVSHRAALPMLGLQRFPSTRTKQLQRLAYAHRRVQRVRKILDEAMEQGTLDARRLPLSWRGAYEERIYLGERYAGKGNNLLLPFSSEAKQKQDKEAKADPFAEPQSAGVTRKAGAKAKA